MSTTPMFDARLLGQTEKACNAILDRLLAGNGLTEPQWVTLTLTSVSDGPADAHRLTDRVSGALKVSVTEAQARLTELSDARLVRVPDDPRAPVTLTDDGRRLYTMTRAEVTEVTNRLWGDLPTEDLATAGRVLSIVLGRANAQLTEDLHARAD
jgi:hypothetical protein